MSVCVARIYVADPACRVVREVDDDQLRLDSDQAFEVSRVKAQLTVFRSADVPVVHPASTGFCDLRHQILPVSTQLIGSMQR